MADCTTKSNLTRQQCESNFGQIKGFYLDEINAGLSYSAAATEAAWIAKINAAEGARLYIPIPSFADEITRTVEEAIIQTGNTGKVRKIRDGKVSYILRFDALSFGAMERLKSFDGSQMYAYAVTDTHIIAKDNGTNIVPFAVNVYVGEAMSPETQDGSWSINLYIYLIDTDNYFQKAIETTDFSPSQETGINDITVTIVSSSAAGTNIVFDVTGQEVESIVDLTTFGDWIVTLTAGSVARTETAISNVGNRYTLTVTDITAAAHTLAFKNQPSATVKGYELQTAVSFVCGA